ncbi:hypothetical protein AAFN90_13500 [Erwiniaceae bacterium CAU 1747]
MVLAHEVQEPFREESMEEQRNRFCQRDKELSFHKWDFYDAARWRFHKSNEHDVTGAYYLWAYKAAFLQYNRERIIRYARQEKVPLLLLAGTVVNEVGGKPDRGKYLIYLKRLFLDDVKNGNNRQSNATSFGAVAMQLRAAAETLGIDPATLTTTEQLQLAGCLMDDSFNIQLAARHLRDLILFDNPQLADTSHLTEEQFIVAAARYNRGTQRARSDIIDSLTAPEDAPEREYSSYGRDMLKKKRTILEVLGVHE